MRRSVWVTLLAFTLIILLTTPVTAARREVGVIYNNIDTPSDPNYLSSQVTLTWNFLTGDSLHYTWDGRTWNAIPITGVNNQPISVTPSVYIPYYANIYFEVRKSSYAPGDRNASDSQNFVTIPVYPPLRNAHSELSTNTDFCAACHVTHAAEGPKLIKAPNNMDLCRMCHGPGATGSRYSVWDGTVRLKNGTKARSNGGPVAAGPAVAEWGNRSVTSSHVDANQGPYPGFDINILMSEPFDCNGCHLPHAKYNSYRLLPGAWSVPVWAWVYNPTGNTPEQVYYEKFDSAICYNCHSLFGTGPGSGSSIEPMPPDPYNGMDDLFRHTTYDTDVTSWNGGAANPTNPLPLEKDKQIFCLTCHFPHGTVATGQQPSSYDKDNNGLYDDYTTSLKRMDNMGICQNCHKK